MTSETPTDPTPVDPPGDTGDDDRLDAVAERIEEARAAASDVASHQDTTDEAREAEAEAAPGTEQGTAQGTEQGTAREEGAAGLPQEGSEIAPG